MGLSFTIAGGPYHSHVRVPRNSLAYFTVLDARLVQPGWPDPRIYNPPGTGWPSCTPRHWVPFSSSLTTRRAMVELFDPASTENWITHTWSLFSITALQGPNRKLCVQQYLYCCRGVFTSPLHRNDRSSTVVCARISAGTPLPSRNGRYIFAFLEETAVHTTILKKPLQNIKNVQMQILNLKNLKK
jgi:hypothetical protein